MLEEPNKPDITDKEILCLEVAGLCHDLGLYYKVSQLKRRVRQFFDGVFILIFQDMDQLFIPKFKKPGDQTWEVGNIFVFIF